MVHRGIALLQSSIEHNADLMSVEDVAALSLDLESILARLREKSSPAALVDVGMSAQREVIVSAQRSNCMGSAKAGSRRHVVAATYESGDPLEIPAPPNQLPETHWKQAVSDENACKRTSAAEPNSPSKNRLERAVTVLRASSRGHRRSGSWPGHQSLPMTTLPSTTLSLNREDSLSSRISDRFSEGEDPREASREKLPRRVKKMLRECSERRRRQQDELQPDSNNCFSFSAIERSLVESENCSPRRRTLTTSGLEGNESGKGRKSSISSLLAQEEVDADSLMSVGNEREEEMISSKANRQIRKESIRRRH